MTAPTSGSTRTKFSNPPITEVAVSLFHLPVLELRAQHIGLYWNRIRDRYPLCNQQPVVALVPTDQQQLFMDMPGEIFPLPRFWFYSDKHPTLIQVQRNAFLLNWRRLEGTDPGDYPHYEEVIKDFWKEIEIYMAFLAEVLENKIDVLQRCELNYINLIQPSEFFNTLDDIKTVLPWLSGLADLAASGRELAGLNSAISHRLNQNLQLDIGVRLGRRSDGGEIGLGLDIKAHGIPADLSLDGARAWYELAHDAIYQMFLELTSKEMQEKLWMPR